MGNEVDRPYGRVRKSGMRWSDDIVRRLGILWTRSAQDRLISEKIEEAYARERY